MRFSRRSLLLPVLLAGTAVPLAALPASAADGGRQTPPSLSLGAGPSDRQSVTVVRPSADGRTEQVPVTGAELTQYDASGGHAVLSSGGGGLKGGTSGQLRAGDVIAGPATSVTPRGALLKVKAVHPRPGGPVSVDTEPATLADALGDGKADVRVPLTAADLKVKPGGDGGKVTEGRGGGQGVRFDVDVPMPSGVKPTPGHSSALRGHLALEPEMLFSYERAHWYSVQPSRATIGMAADYDYGFAAHAEGTASYDTGRRPLHIPAAEVDVDKTVWLGPVPVVLNLKVTYFYDVSADGRITLDAEQDTKGHLEVGATYDAGRGWSALSGPEPTTTATPARVEGSATAKGGVGTHAELGLYGSAGVAADVMPYLKATVHGTAGTGDTKADRALYGGGELTGSFFAELGVFGMKVLDKTWEFPKVSYEHKLAGSGS
ncbi:hypothetical protein [Streptomyces caatingaensis]|uniref:Lipoprotein n=1 Tax=Streptomyces caatingaensis TaxID=1678637 RepID=A0A0K9XGI2_9ACTN|nr:hypothetical protein [Streptomyces caatingaensis]KNB52353.1 hypothetical protein AC230_12555 [Streptomyces caatingaensis]